ncbi:MAG: uroporphyrinogen decarboxylase family protein [Clostridia bacterium]
MQNTNYNTARDEMGFDWYIGSSVYAFLEIAGINLHEYNKNPLAGVEAYSEKYFTRLKEMFGDYLLPVSPSTPSISYGHINFLGVELIFPEGEGEVNYCRQKKSLDEWIEILKNNMSFNNMTPEGSFYLDYRNILQKAYPGEPVNWGMGYEGPATTAYELRDMDFFYDLYDDPEKTREFLRLLSLNIVEYIKFHRRINGQQEFNIEGGGMCDDIASMIPPEMFGDFVLPYWEIFYTGITSGKRWLHTEDHTYKTMKYLEKADISYFDPSISHKLNPRLIRDNCRVPFGWRMGSFHFRDLKPEDVEDWVYKAVEDGASKVFTHVTKNMLDNSHIEKVKAFHKAASNAKKIFDSGASREEIGKLVSPAGRERFWDKWPG